MSIFSGFRCHLGRQHDTQEPPTLLRRPPERCHTAHEPCKTAFNTRPERSRPPRTSQTSKMTPKSRWGTPPSLNFGANMDAVGLVTLLEARWRVRSFAALRYKLSFIAINIQILGQKYLLKFVFFAKSKF